MSRHRGAAVRTGGHRAHADARLRGDRPDGPAFLAPSIASGAKDLPLALSAPEAAQHQLLTQLETSAPGVFDVTVVEDTQAVSNAVENREAIAAISLTLLGLQQLMGYAGLGLGVVLMLFVANPLSGLATGWQWLPGGCCEHWWGRRSSTTPLRRPLRRLDLC